MSETETMDEVDIILHDSVTGVVITRQGLDQLVKKAKENVKLRQICGEVIGNEELEASIKKAES